MYYTTVKQLLDAPENKQALEDFEKNIFESACDVVDEETAKIYAASAKSDIIRGLDVFANVFDDMTSKIKGSFDVIKIAAARSAAQHFIDTCDGIGKQLHDYSQNCDMFLSFGKDCVAVTSTMIKKNLVKDKQKGETDNG